ncbi:hypothetical protein EPUL_004196, partial [Erysiphe pulchra]
MASLSNLQGEPMDLSQGEVLIPPTIPSLSPNQIAQLLSLLNVEEKPKPRIRQPPINKNDKKPSKWPEWDGSKENYSTYIDLLLAKIDVDWDHLGGHKA